MQHETIPLPKTNAYGFYESRLESIGGLGANLSGKILGELGALYLRYNTANFASYGSEKRGTPVKSYIRYAEPDKEIRISSPVEKPHLIGIFHERLAGKTGVLAGVDEETAVVVNTAKSPDEIRREFQMHGGVLTCIDGMKITVEEKTRMNMIMLGALCKASGFLPFECLEEIIRETIGRKYPAMLDSNLRGLRRGFEEGTTKAFPNDETYPYVPFTEERRSLGWDNAPLGGVVVTAGSTVSNDVSASREGYVPLFHQEKCIQCGMCDTACPDMVYQFVKGEWKGKPAMVNLGPDYHHCKGCLRCVEVCPTAAITAGIEYEQDIWKQHVRNQDLIVERLEFEDLGANSIVNEEKY